MAVRDIQKAIGARASAKLSRKMGGAAAYVRCAKPNRKQLTQAEYDRMTELALRGFYECEIATILGRSISSVSIPREVKRLLDRPTSSYGKIVRAALREGRSLDEALAEGRAHNEAVAAYWRARDAKNRERWAA